LSRAGRFVVPGGHPALAGHFPGRPLVPGSLILDLVIAAWGGPCLGVQWAKFHALLPPDLEVLVSFEPTQDPGAVRFECRCADRPICSGRLLVLPTPGEPPGQPPAASPQ
jgi:3-hydroxymyristoyl/3-hydroxydecanoyl-(acyl carrier protein) dehydratase